MGILKKFTKKADKKVFEEKKNDTQKPTVLASVPKKVDSKKKVEKPARPLGRSDGKPVVKKSSKTKSTFYLTEAVLYPVVTEKSAVLASSNKYVFAIDKNANKIQVRSAIKAMYGITPVSVNIQNMKGKKVRHGRKFGKRKDWKKAIVTLPEGKTIDVYEGV